MGVASAVTSARPHSYRGRRTRVSAEDRFDIVGQPFLYEDGASKGLAYLFWIAVAFVTAGFTAERKHRLRLRDRKDGTFHRIKFDFDPLDGLDTFRREMAETDLATFCDWYRIRLRTADSR